MFVDDKGLLIGEDSDGFNVSRTIRGSNYGPMVTGTPVLGINHVYGIFVPYGKDSSPRADGTVGCASRIASGKAPYYGQVYMARGSVTDGVPGADLYQVVPLDRCGIHCEGRVKLDDPKFSDSSGIRFFNNKCSVGIEWAGSGWFRKDGTDWTGPKGRKGWNGKVYDLSREDFQLIGNFYWQKPTTAQIYTAQRFWAAVVARYETLSPKDCGHGHAELGSGGHMCPGPPIMSALVSEVLPYLGEGGPTVEPEEFSSSYVEPLLQSMEARDVFAQFGGFLSDEQLHAYFTPSEIECYVKSGAISTEDTENMVSLSSWHWVEDVDLFCES